MSDQVCECGHDADDHKAMGRKSPCVECPCLYYDRDVAYSAPLTPQQQEGKATMATIGNTGRSATSGSPYPHVENPSYAPEAYPGAVSSDVAYKKYKPDPSVINAINMALSKPWTSRERAEGRRYSLIAIPPESREFITEYYNKAGWEVTTANTGSGDALVFKPVESKTHSYNTVFDQ